MVHLRTYSLVFIVLIGTTTTTKLKASKAESRVFNDGYAFEAPINVGGESAYGFENNYGSTESDLNNFFNGLYNDDGYSSSNGALYFGQGLNNNGIGFADSTSELGYGLAANTYQSGYPGLHSHNDFGQNAGSFNPTSNFGDSFYPGSGHLFVSNFAGLGVQRPFQIDDGLESYGHSSKNLVSTELSSGYPFDTAYTGHGNNFVGFNAYGGSNFDSSLSYESQQNFK